MNLPNVTQVMTIEVDLDISDLIFGDLSNTDDVRKAVVAAVEKVLKADAMNQTVKVLAVEDHINRQAAKQYNGAWNQQRQAMQQYQAIQNQMGVQSLQQLSGLQNAQPHSCVAVDIEAAQPTLIQRIIQKAKGN